MSIIDSRRALWLSAWLALLGCRDNSRQAHAASALQLVDEPAGANCANGGQALQLGHDHDQNGTLSTQELLHTAYICEGRSATLRLSRAAIPVGDPRCPSGGSSLLVTDDSQSDQPWPARELVLCRGVATGTNSLESLDWLGVLGLRSAPGAAEAKAHDALGIAAAGSSAEERVASQSLAAAMGAEGLRLLELRAAPQPHLNQFSGTQIVAGAIVTCDGVETSDSTSECRGLKINGLDARLGEAEIRAICQAVTGFEYFITNGVGLADDPYLTWDGTTWTVGAGRAAPMDNLSCNRSRF